MKFIIITIVIISLVVGAGAYYITTEKSRTTVISVVRDITEDSLHWFKAGEFDSFYKFSEDKWQGGAFRARNISNVSMSRVYETKLSPANQWLSNEFERRKAIKKFSDEVSKGLHELDKEARGKQQSSVYLPIAKELNHLAASKADRRMLFIYSDLMENISGLSFYNKRTFGLITAKPSEIQKYFEKDQPINDLTGITVYIVYEPKDPAKDIEFQIVSAFYKNLLESKGATVEITTNI